MTDWGQLLQEKDREIAHLKQHCQYLEGLRFEEARRTDSLRGLTLRLYECIKDVGDCGVSYSARKWVEVQIDHDTWKLVQLHREEYQKLVDALKAPV